MTNMKPDTEKHAAEQQSTQPTEPKPWAYDFWKFMHDEHGLILLESDIHDILREAAPFITNTRADTALEAARAALEDVTDSLGYFHNSEFWKHEHTHSLEKARAALVLIAKGEQP